MSHKLSNKEILMQGKTSKHKLKKDFALKCEVPPLPKMPYEIPIRVQQIYFSIANETVSAGTISHCDGIQLFKLANTMYKCEINEALLEKEGEVINNSKTITTQKGTTVTNSIIKNPRFAVVMEYNKQINSMLSLFGLNPLSRSRFTLEPVTEESEKERIQRELMGD